MNHMGLSFFMAAILAGNAQSLYSAESDILEISPKDERGLSLGPMKAGTVLRLQYVSGKWKGWGALPSASPDDPNVEGGERNRVAIVSAPTSGPVELLSLVPADTARQAFEFTAPRNLENVALRINDNDNNWATNPDGHVKYRVTIGTASVIPQPAAKQSLPAKPPVAPTQPKPPEAAPPAAKQNTFEICSTSTSYQHAVVDSAWRRNALCVQAVVRLNESVGAKAPSLKAYFYNKNRQLVLEHKHPSLVQDHPDPPPAPERFLPGRKYMVFFGVNNSIERGKDKWKHAIIVFGNRDKAAAEIYPKEDIAQFDFPEKALVIKGRGK